MHFHTLLLDYSNLPYCSNWSPNSSSPSSSSSPALSPINSESSSNGGRSLPGLDVRGSVLRPRDPREGLVAAEKGSEDVSSCINKNKIVWTRYWSHTHSRPTGYNKTYWDRWIDCICSSLHEYELISHNITYTETTCFYLPNSIMCRSSHL